MLPDIEAITVPAARDPAPPVLVTGIPGYKTEASATTNSSKLPALVNPIVAAPLAVG